jgi:CheY-like chemotaxis protein
MRMMIIDNELAAAHKFAEVLRSVGHEVEVPDSPKEALDLASSFEPHLVIAEYDLGRSLSGAELCQMIRGVRPEVHFIALTRNSGPETLLKFKRVNPLMHFYKPINLEDFLEYLQSVQLGIGGAIEKSRRVSKSEKGLKIEKEVQRPAAVAQSSSAPKSRFRWIDKITRRETKAD